MSDSIISNSQTKYKYKEYRCPKCFLVPFINLSNIDNKLFMSIKCITNDDHNDSKPFDEMEKMCTCPISNNFCINCKSENKENKKLSNNFFYCSKCLKFFCSKHGEIHNLKEKHEVFLNKNLNSICFEHNGKSIVGYCSNHNKNYCINCNHYNENNKMIDEELNDNEIKKFEDEIKKNEKIIKEINLLFYNYKNLIKELENNFLLYKENINKKIKFMNEIINFYKIKKAEKDINYQMKANIQNIFFKRKIFFYFC